MIKSLKDRLKVNFKNDELLLQALTHSSFANENPNTKDNERLEFLGDAIIGFLMAEHLYKEGYKDEGILSKKRAQAVCEEALYIYAEHLNLSSYLRLGKGEAKTKTKVVADAFEAVLAAVYLEHGFAEVRQLFYRIVIPYLDEVSDIRDYKSTLQEIFQINQKTVVYELINEEGPSHNKEFTVIVKVDDEILGEGIAGSKKEAEQQAAKQALKKIETEK